MADTRRDIIQRVKVNGEDVAYQIQALNRLFTADPTTVGSPQKAAIDKVNANVTAITTAMAAYAAAAV